MAQKPCKLFDENIVHSIITSTGHSVVEYMRENGYVDAEEITDYLEVNAGDIINDTISRLRETDCFREMGGDNAFEDTLTTSEEDEYGSEQA